MKRRTKFGLVAAALGTIAGAAAVAIEYSRIVGSRTRRQYPGFQPPAGSSRSAEPKGADTNDTDGEGSEMGSSVESPAMKPTKKAAATAKKAVAGAKKGAASSKSAAKRITVTKKAAKAADGSDKSPAKKSAKRIGSKRTASKQKGW